MYILKNVDTLGDDNAFGLVNTQCGVLQNQYLAQQGIAGAPSPGGRPGDVFQPYLLPMNVGPTELGELGFIAPMAVAQLNDPSPPPSRRAPPALLYVALQAAFAGALTAGAFKLSGAKSHWKPAALVGGTYAVTGLIVTTILAARG